MLVSFPYAVVVAVSDPWGVLPLPHPVLVFGVVWAGWWLVHERR